ncbi:GNAT family N-acetyltransferase [Candidatus Gottesmanbacteria bacterium]|nr:GNAT family N-acetyltransferase [Candidatus Gottesmanbacteria bacterium]
MLTIKEIKLEDHLSWDDLIKESSTATFFQTKEWLTLWVKHWCKSGEVVIYGVFDKYELIGIAPFHISDKINILGVPDPSLGGSLSDFGDIIAKISYEKIIWQSILAKLNTHPSAGGSKLKTELNYIREESPSLKILRELGGQIENMEVSPFIDLPKTWDEYMSSLTRHDRHEIRRKTRKIEEENITKICDEINPQNINDFFRLMVSSKEKKSDFLSSKMRVFLSEMIIQLEQKKLLTLCFLKYENVNIAAILLLFQKDEVLLYNSGFEKKYSYLSPGLILNIYAIKQAIEERKSRFDFLRGGEKYKYDLGGKNRKLYKVTF